MITCNVEKITPDVAKALLQMNTNNFRNADPHRVEKYALEMESGKWECNGDTIKINGTTLLDGQHRLMAVIKSNSTIESLVARGVETDASTIDRGKPRSIGQYCAHIGVKHASTVAAIARLAVFYENGHWGKTSINSNDVLDSKIIEMVEANKSVLESCARICNPTTRIISPSIIGAIMFIGCDKRDPQLRSSAMWFVEKLVKGDDLCDVDAVFHLRNRFLNQSKGSGLSRPYKRWLATIAWNRTMAGESTKPVSLRVRFTGPAKQSPPSKIELAPTDY